MDGFKEFQGKDLDAAIQDACLYYNAGREKLEIEIIQDAKSGIFGIVGARKARIRARRSHFRDAVQSVLGEIGSHIQPEADSCTGKEMPDTDAAAVQDGRKKGAESRLPQADHSAEPQSGQKDKGSRRDRKPQGTAPKKPDRTSSRSSRKKADEESLSRHSEYAVLEEAEYPAAEEAARQAVAMLLDPLSEAEPVIDTSMQDGIVFCSVQGLGDEAAIIIGRDGATLTALQYLASRISSRKLQKSVRISLEVGTYRQRQEEDLRAMAKALSEKVLSSGKPMTTRPLSASQRRIIHLFLKGKEGIQTRSTGDGELKRVLIMCKKAKPAPKASPKE